MKQLKKIYVVVVALALTIVISGPVFANDPTTGKESDYLNGLTVEAASTDFSTLAGLSDDPMDDAEMDEVVGGRMTKAAMGIPTLELGSMWPNPCPIEAFGCFGPLPPGEPMTTTCDVVTGACRSR